MKCLKYNLTFYFTRFLHLTCKYRIHDEEQLITIKNKKKPIIFVVWHCHFTSFVFTHSFQNISVVTSMSKDGDLGAYLLNKYGFVPIRGSSSKGAVKAMLQVKKSIETGYNTAITLDGPKGPRFEVKSGAIYMAKLANSTILPVLFSINHYKMFNSWDRFIVPYPFATIDLYYGQPFNVSSSKERYIIEKERNELQQTMMALTRRYAPEII